MNQKDKLEAIKTLKGVMVRYQQWDFCAWLRDLERRLESQLGLKFLHIKENITCEDYYFFLELISTFSSEWTESVNSQNLIDIVNREFRDIIRQIKIDQIL